MIVGRARLTSEVYDEDSNERRTGCVEDRNPGVVTGVIGGALLATPRPAPAEGASPGPPLHPKGRPASKFTIELRNGIKATLPFETSVIRGAKRGFIAEPPYKQIMADAGHVAWDMGSYAWLSKGTISRAFILAAAPGRVEHGLRPL